MKSDIRLEVILTDLITEDLSIEDVLIESDSLFKRNYHYDIETTSETVIGPGKKKKIRFVVNREGIYDQLPEDLFHQVSETKNATDKEETLEEIKIQRELEKQSRLFFQPFEQEFYRQRIKLEVEERKFLFETNHILPGEIFNSLWNLPDFLDDLQKSKLGLLMPVLSKMTGKKELLSFIINSITGDLVEIRETPPGKWKINDHPVLGEMQLSVNSLLGGELSGLEPGYKIVIFLSDAERIMDYMPGGKKILIYEFLCDLLLPLDSEIIIETDLTNTSTSFMIKKDENCLGRLNYTTII
jgi:type VI secretion system protein ImpH